MSGNKNYSDLRLLALGAFTHEEVANKLLQLNATSTDLRTIASGAHDRIMHLAQLTNAEGNAEEFETLRRQLQDAETRIAQFSAELTEALSKVEDETSAKNSLQGQVNVLTAELNHIRATYDLPDEDGEDEDEDGVEEGTDSERGALTGYMPTREELKVIATENGFKVRAQTGGKEDLADYVYVTMEKTVEFAHARS